MFPFDLDDNMVVVEEEKKIPTDYEIDFETGKLTGRMVTGLEAVKQWIRLCLTTDRYYFPQYSWSYGSDLSSLIGQNYDEEYINTEVKRMIKEALSVDESITGYEDLKIEMLGDKLSISFTVNTIFGRGDIYV